MGLVKCTDCGKTISDQSSVCIGCGKPMAENVTSALPQSPNSNSQYKEISNKSGAGVAVKQKKSFSWKAFVAAFIIAVLINIVAAAASGGQPAKNIWWTVMWIYFSIEAWHYWRWKALLPYPIFGFVSTILGMIMVGNNVDKMAWGYIGVKMTLNIGGLVIFYLLLRKSKKEAALHKAG